jgi:hypothetical protein
MPTCTQQEAACALDCLKSTEVEEAAAAEVEFSFKCSACKLAAGKIAYEKKYGFTTCSFLQKMQGFLIIGF